MEKNWARIKNILRKKNNDDLVLPDIKTYYKAVLMKTMWYLCGNR